MWIADWPGARADAVDRTRAALADSTVRPEAILPGTLRDALTQTRAERMLLVRAGDAPAPVALERLGQAVALASDANVITCDDDLLAPDGSGVAPRFRPGPSPDRWLACDDSGPMLVVNRAAAAAVAADGLAGGSTWRHDLALALAGRAGSGHAHMPSLLCHRGAGSQLQRLLDPETLERPLRDWAPAARVEPAGPALRRIRWPVAGARWST
jgi:hypothetical protein